MRIVSEVSFYPVFCILASAASNEWLAARLECQAYRTRPLGVLTLEQARQYGRRATRDEMTLGV